MLPSNLIFYKFIIDTAEKNSPPEGFLYLFLRFYFLITSATGFALWHHQALSTQNKILHQTYKLHTERSLGI